MEKFAKKILLACSDYYPHTFGGTEVYVKNYANFIKENGGEATIIASTPSEYFTEDNTVYKDDTLKVCKYVHDQVTVFGVYHLKSTSTDFIYSRYQKADVTSWENFIKQHPELSNLDILHINSFTAVIGLNLFKAIIKHNTTVRVITSYHTPISCIKGTLMFGNTLNECSVDANLNHCNDCLNKTQTKLPYLVAKGINYLKLNQAKLPTIFKTKHLVQLNITAFEQLNAITHEWWCYSNGIRKTLLKNHINPDRIKMARHGIDKIFFASNPVKSSDKNIYLFSGRLTPIKGIITLLKAWLKLPEQHNKELWITANPVSANATIQELVKQASLRKDIVFIGEKNQSEIATLYSAAHFVVIPSECFEIGPLVFHEAIANQCNIICSDIGGCKELAAFYKDGVTCFKTADVTSLTKCIAHSSYRLHANHEVVTTNNHFSGLIMQQNLANN